MVIAILGAQLQAGYTPPASYLQAASTECCALGKSAQHGAVAFSRPLPGRLPCANITVAMAERYFLNKSGVKTTRMQGLPGKGHIDIGREVLAREGIVPADDHAVYTQMFRLQFVRVVEHDDGRVEVEHGRPLTKNQKHFLNALEDQGKKLVYVSVKR